MFRKLVAINIRALLDRSTRSSGKKRRLPLPLILVLGFVFILLMIYLGFSEILFKPLLLTVAGTPLQSLYWTVIGFLALVMSWLSILFMTGPMVFAAKDNDRLLSMPIRPITIVMSRITGLYFFALLILSFFFIPAFVVQIEIVGFNAASAGMLLLCLLVFPLLSLSLALILGLLLHLVSGHLARFKTVITMAVSIASLIAYFYFIMNLQNAMIMMVERGNDMQESFRRVLPFMHHFGEAVAGTSVRSLLIFAAWAVLPAALVILLINRIFLYLARRVSSTHKSVFRGVRETSLRLMPSLLLREWRHYSSAPMVMMNTGIAAIMAIGLAGFLWFSGGEVVALIGLPELAPFMPGGLLAIVLFLASTALISASSISLEGKSIWLLKTLPVKAATILASKVMFHWLVLGPFFLILSLTIVIMFGASLWQSILFLILPQLIIILFGQAGLIANLYWPRFDYLNETAVVKQSVSVIVAMVASFVFSGLLIAGYALIWNRIGTLDQYIAVVTVFMLLLIAGLGVYLNTAGVRRFRGLQAP